ncbi:phosphate ABC transporter permease PstA [Actinomyces polynesiensis]|uniref:phosphate ABC transporter permease PstA n=1 Tax=Actinomyces polynesiensis TaxID=1325934 RepID=UPI000693660D|nr:phosphate ABC transporter permease PstA [Actinomyces polynesiensis]
MTTTTARAPRERRTSPFASTDPAWDRRRAVKDKAALVGVSVAFLLAMVPLVSLVWTVLSNGYLRLTWSFLTTDMVGVFGGKPNGGIAHAIVGTLLITLWATLISAPIGVFAAIYLVEYGAGNRLAKATTFFVDVMTGIPSIVAGLFAAALFTITVGSGYRAGIMGAVALSVLMIPTVVRSSEEMLRLVPNELREASYALGVPKWRTIVKVVLRTSAAGLTTSVMLAIARVIGETAPLLMTVGFIEKMNTNVFDGRMTTLPVYVYRQYSQGLATCRAGVTDCVTTINYERAWAAALVLIIIVMLLNLIARGIARAFAPKGR